MWEVKGREYKKLEDGLFQLTEERVDVLEVSVPHTIKEIKESEAAINKTINWAGSIASFIKSHIDKIKLNMDILSEANEKLELELDLEKIEVLDFDEVIVKIKDGIVLPE